MDKRERAASEEGCFRVFRVDLRTDDRPQCLGDCKDDDEIEKAIQEDRKKLPPDKSQWVTYPAYDDKGSPHVFI